jgi:hypothetical protein
MSVIGKIFVFLVLILSLVQGGLTVVLYTARTTWAAQNKDLQAQLKVAQANALQWQADGKLRDDLASKHLADKDQEINNLKAEMKGKNDQISDFQRAELQRKQESVGLQETVKAAQADLKRQQADNEQLKGTLTTEMAKNKTLNDEAIVLRQDKIQAEIRANSLAEVNQKLEKALEDSARQIAQLKAPLTGATAKAGNGKNPPPEKVEGLIRQVTEGPNGMVKITIGSDAGLQKGHTLEVFRLANVADQSKYLGTVKIMEVYPTEAVAQPLGRMSGPLQVGDTVASRILGN